MSATVELIKTTGEAGYESETSKSNIVLKVIDDASTAAADSPIQIPNSGTNYSYESWCRFKCTVAPSNQLDTFKVWSDGSSVATGVIITANTDAVDTYATPVITQSTQGTRESFSNRDSGSKVSVAGTLTGVGDKTDFVVFQMEVASTASPGDISYTVNYSYDEQ